LDHNMPDLAYAPPAPDHWGGSQPRMRNGSIDEAEQRMSYVDFSSPRKEGW
jgi:hypothetical protein